MRVAKGTQEFQQMRWMDSVRYFPQLGKFGGLLSDPVPANFSTILN